MEKNPAALEDRGQSRRQSFLQYSGESSEVDYKDGVLLKANEPFTIKLVKHILGMCNAGGGFIVIGYIEDDHKRPVPGTMDESIAGSYDLSLLASIVEKYTAGSDKIQLLVHKDINPDNGITYPIIEVAGFKKRPFFCKSAGSGILQEGALYIRIASARTIKVASPEEWDQLIDLCVERRTEETLQRFSSLISEIGLNTTDSLKPISSLKEHWVLENKAKVAEIYAQQNWQIHGLEFSHWLNISANKWPLPQLLDACEKAVRKNTGWPIGLVVHQPNYQPVPKCDGIEALFSDKTKRFDFWRVNASGDYFYFRGFEEDHLHNATTDSNSSWGKLYFVSRIWRIAEIIDHTIALYQALGINSTTILTLNISHLGISKRSLVSDNANYPLVWSRVSYSDEANWTKQCSLDFLIANRKELTLSISKELFALFNFFEPAEDILERIVDEFDASW